MLSSNTSVRSRCSPANSPRNSPCPSPHGSPRFKRKTESYRKNRKAVVPVLIVHGTPFGRSDSVAEDCLEGIKQATVKGYEVLMHPESSVSQAVEAAVHHLETNPIFNQGILGSSYGDVRMDSLLMEGRKLRAGCILGVRNIYSPIKVAHHLMEKNGQFTLVGDAAEQFVKEIGNLEYFNPRMLLDNSNKIDKEEYRDLIECSFSKIPRSVGAVAVDAHGRVACAWSSKTIGCDNGIITPIATVGSAAFCDDYIGAVSCTGSYGADAIPRVCLARHISGLMQQSNMSAQDAVVAGLEYMQNRINGACGGAVAVSNNGDIGIHFTTDRMTWAYKKAGQLTYGMNPREYLSEDFNQDCLF